jgi:hypothetical protein
MYLLLPSRPGISISLASAGTLRLPRFYLDTSDGDFLCRDQIGHELAGPEEARLLALSALPDMAHDKLPGGDRHDFICNVRDAAGRPIYTATLSLAARWLE